MRFLLDEDMDPRLAMVLRALRHDADHIRDIGLAGATDERVARAGADYDVLVTMDLHRQNAEWVKISEALLASTRVIRLRFPGSLRVDLMAQARAMILRWGTWTHEFDQGARLITISGAGSNIRAASVDDINEMLAGRSS